MSEVRALLLTDVADSTRLAEALGDTAAAALWATHDRLARDLLPLWRGREIDKSDGMLLLFEAVADAAGYAIAYHGALAGLDPPLQARAGLHVGRVVLRENSVTDVARGAKMLEVDGVAKAVAARIMGLANAGQTLLSGDAQHALGERELRRESHGHWRMKGIAEPIELFEIGSGDKPFVPPPDAAKGYRVVRAGDVWLPVRAIPHSLPAERDSFVGRRETLAELAQRFDAGARLVSVLGIGGTGKTRLVTRFGWNWLGDFPGGIWFCDLAQARSLDGIMHAVAQGLDVPLGKDDPATQIGNAIAGRGSCLVVLDNFEQVARHADETLGRWLDRARDARFLATTREVLGLPGEEILALAPLPPTDAAALFMRRAEAAKSGFRLTPEDDSAIAPLMKLLDGLPLAIELAAARVRVMPPRTLLLRMNERFRLLSSTGGRVDRQATLRAVFDWSWDLLELSEKAALAQLSVFEGGFTLEAMEAIIDLSACGQATWNVDALQSLVQKSLVRQLTRDRFDLLVSLQEYAAEQLRSAGRYPESGSPAALAAQVRHGAWFASLDERAAVADGCADTDNLVAACRRAVARGDADTAARALQGAWASLTLRGPFRLGVELASEVQAVRGLGAADSAGVHWVAGRALEATGNSAEAHRQFEAALEAAQIAGDRRCECRALLGIGFLDRNLHAHGPSRARFEAALAIAREIRDAALESDAENGLGTLDHLHGRFSDARGHLEAGLLRARDAGDRQREGGLLGNLGGLHGDMGNLELATAHYGKALAAAREAGNRKLEGNTLCNLGLLHLLQGRNSDAVELLDAALAICRESGHKLVEGIVLCNLGIAADNLARYDEARDRFEAALEVARESGDQHSEGQFLGYLGLLHAHQARFGAARECLDAGAALLGAAPDRTILCILLCQRAEAEHLAGNAAAARAAFAAAQEINVDVRAGPGSELDAALERARGMVAPP